MQTAGRAVVFSGATVAIGLALLIFMPLPFIRAIGIGGFLLPVVSLLAALTLQPALLSIFGRLGGLEMNNLGVAILVLLLGISLAMTLLLVVGSTGAPRGGSGATCSRPRRCSSPSPCPSPGSSAGRDRRHPVRSRYAG